MSIAARIKDAAEIHGKFTLRSGKKSSLYFDKYRFEADPTLLYDITREMVALVPDGLVEDVVSSGGPIIDTARRLRDDGIVVEKALCVIDRETGGKEKLAEVDISLVSLLCSSDIEEASNKV